MPNCLVADKTDENCNNITVHTGRPYLGHDAGAKSSTVASLLVKRQRAVNCPTATASRYCIASILACEPRPHRHECLTYYNCVN